MKRDYPPLIQPGILDYTLDDLQAEFVDAFPGSHSRPQIMARFRVFLDRLRITGLDCEIWVNGSFITEKLNPADIDAVVFCYPAEVKHLGSREAQIMLHLFGDPVATKARYLTDVRYAERGDSDRRMYWRGVFGFGRDDSPKGFLRLDLTGA